MTAKQGAISPEFARGVADDGIAAARTAEQQLRAVSILLRTKRFVVDEELVHELTAIVVQMRIAFEQLKLALGHKPS